MRKSLIKSLLKKLKRIVVTGGLSTLMIFSAVACKGKPQEVTPQQEEPKIEQPSDEEFDDFNNQIEQTQDNLNTSKYSSELLKSNLADLKTQILTLNELINAKADLETIETAMIKLNELINSLQEQLAEMPDDEAELKEDVKATLASAIKIQTEQMAFNSLQVKSSGKTYGNSITGYDKSYTFYYTPENGGNYAFTTESEELDLPIVTKDGLKFSKDIDGNENIETFNNDTNFFTQALNDIKNATSITKEGDIYTISNDQRTLSRIESKDGIRIASIEELQATENGNDIKTSHTFNYEDFNFEEISASIGSTMPNYVNYSTVADSLNTFFKNEYFSVEDFLGNSTQKVSELTAIYSNDAYAEKNSCNGFKNYYVSDGKQNQSFSVDDNGKIQESEQVNITKQDFINNTKSIIKTGLQSVKYDAETQTYTLTLNSKNELSDMVEIKTIKIKLNEDCIEIVVSNENNKLSENCKLNEIKSEAEFLEKFEQITNEIKFYTENEKNIKN